MKTTLIPSPTRAQDAASSVAFAVLIYCLTTFCVSAADISVQAQREIAALLQEKATRTPTQLKLESQLIHALKTRQGQVFAVGVTNLQPDVQVQPDGRVLVDLKAVVTPALQDLIRANGGRIINSFSKFQAIRALVPVDQLESLAASPDIKSIRRADEAHTSTGSVNAEGDNTHLASAARSAFGVTGSGVRVGVLSDSVDFLSLVQATGDLGPVTVLLGQSGVGHTGEGTAMLEIIHDLAPDAQLFFATAFNGQASFAQNILDLRDAGCDVIVDDVFYLNESPFQDGIIAQAVNSVTAAGGLYFSSAGNSGSKDAGTSGTWEGDFVDGGPAGDPIGVSGSLHMFGGATYNTVTASGQYGGTLSWSDPLGASTNDFDLFVLDATGSTVVRSSTTSQTGTQDPYEYISAVYAGERIVIVKRSGVGRFLHLDTGRGRLSLSTAGATVGHSAATNAFSVAAVPSLSAYPGPFTGGSANPLELFSSDGPRHIFFNADGTAITPGDFSSTGGALRQKPDIAAADGVSTASPNFQRFYGTSAAAPHAAAIAALLLSYNHNLIPSQVRGALTSTSLDIGSVGFDRDSGAGLVMAYQALQFLANTAPPGIVASPADRTVLVGGTAVFTASAWGEAPLSYSWQRDGNAISGATGTSYVLHNAQLSDSGARFHCVVTNAVGAVTSAVASLIVSLPVDNDWCDTATLILSPRYTNAQSTVGATSLGDPFPTCFNDFGNGVWYQYTPPADGQMVVDTIGSDFLTGLAVYTGGCGAPKQAACDVYGGGNLASKISLPVAGGTTYSILAGGYYWTNGNLVIHLAYDATNGPPRIAVQPINRASGIDRTVTFGVTAGGTPPLSYFWQKDGLPIGGVGDSTFSFGPVQVSDSGSQFRCVITNSSGSVTSSVAVLTVNPPPVNDQCGGAIVVLGPFFTNVQSTTLATSVGDPVPDCLPALGNGVWYEFTAPAAGVITIDTVGSDFDTGLAIYTNGCGSLAQIACGDDSDGEVTSVLTNLATAGTSYYILAGGYGAREGNLVFHLGFASREGPPTVLDQPRNQVVASGGSATFSLTAAGTSPLKYQWRKNGSPIEGGTSPTCSLKSVQLVDSGSQFSCLVSNTQGTVLSSNAVLSVIFGDATLITFDELSGSGPIPSGYGGFYWDNFYYLNGATYARTSGYTAGIVSSNNIAYNGYGAVAGITNLAPFDFLSAYLTAAWNDDLQVEVQGYAGKTLKYDNTYTLSAKTPTRIQFNYLGITTVEFTSWGGSPHPGYGGGGTHVVIDNVSLIPVEGLSVSTAYSFQGFDGGAPGSRLVAGEDGTLYGTTTYGGAYGAGTVFKMTQSGVSTLVSFNQANGSSPAAGLVVGPDGDLYGTTTSGGTYGSGTAFKVSTTGLLTTLASFSYSSGSSPSACLMYGADGNFYGTASYGGSYGLGTVFSLTTKGALAMLVAFDSTKGAYPSAELIQTGDGILYGTTSSGGAYGYGTVFSLTTNGTLTTLVSFTYANGAYPTAGLLPNEDGSFFGTTRYGGPNGWGTLFKVTTNGVLTTLASFTYAAGGGPVGTLTRGTDGDLYGVTSSGGNSGLGTIFKATTNGALSTRLSFSGPNGSNPQAALFRDANGNLHGATSSGGSGFNGSSSSGNGTVFRVAFSPMTTPTSITAHPLSRTVPVGGNATFTVQTRSSALLQYTWHRNGEAIAGATEASYIQTNVQSADSGVAFSCLVSNEWGAVSSSNGVLTVLPSGVSGVMYGFTGTDGGASVSRLVRGSDGHWYGTTVFGGANHSGTVFRMTTNGVLTTLFSFNNSSGVNPQAGLVEGADGNLYGTTSSAGPSGYGSVFRLSTNGTLTTLIGLSYANGGSPRGTLLKGADGTLYGTSYYGGPYGYGTVFALTTNGTISTLAGFGYTNGAYPSGDLVRDNDGTLLGTTTSGGATGNGSVFRLSTNGNLTAVVSFNTADGYYPQGGLMSGDDGAFYGTATYGGSFGYGTLFQVTREGALTTLASFGYGNGAYPYTAPVQGPDTYLYGTTSGGGSYGMGTVFRASIDGVVTPVWSFFGTNGMAPQAALAQSRNAGFFDGVFYCTTSYGGPDFNGSGSSGNGTILRLVVPSAAGPILNTNRVTIVKHPTSRRVLPGDTNVSFSVVTAGPVYSRQWYTNGVAVPGATQSSYLSPPIGESDSGTQIYVVVSNNVNAVQSSNAVITVGHLVQVAGVQEKLWFGATRTDVEAGSYDAITPDRQLALTTFSSPQEQGSYFAQRLSGLFVPPLTTNYTFFITSDDAGDLFLSSDPSPAHKTLIAQEIDWSNPLTWLSNNGGIASRQLEQKRSDQWSPDGGVTVPNAAGIPLVAGNVYYLEAVHQEYAGGDEVDVTFKMVGEPDPPDQTPSRIDASVLAPFPLGLDGAYIIVTNPPQSTGAFPNQTVLFTVGATAGYVGDSSGLSPGLAYQWQTAPSGSAQFTNLPGATAASYTTPLLQTADNGRQIRVQLLAGDASSNTIPVTITVVVDSNGDGIPDDWAIAHGFDPSDPSVALADPDGDGLSNLMEYALGNDPHNPADGRSSVVPSVVVDNGSHYVSVTFKRRKIAPGLQYIPEVSGDRQTWYSDGGHVQIINVLPLDDQFDQVTVRDLTPASPVAPRFMRLRLN
jgi:uncharacterized repeat protein (TIGR03803 family)